MVALETPLRSIARREGAGVMRVSIGRKVDFAKEMEARFVPRVTMKEDGANP